MPNKPTRRELALALELTTKQVASIMRIGVVAATTRRRTLDYIKSVELTIPQAGDIWGFRNHGRGLYKHVNSGKLAVTNDGVRKTRVTVAAMLAMEIQLERSARGKKRC